MFVVRVIGVSAFNRCSYRGLAGPETISVWPGSCLFTVGPYSSMSGFTILSRKKNDSFLIRLPPQL